MVGDKRGVLARTAGAGMYRPVGFMWMVLTTKAEQEH